MKKYLYIGTGIIILAMGMILYIKSKKIANLEGKLNYEIFKDSTIRSTTKSGDSVLTKYTVAYKYLPINRQKIIDSVLKEQSIKIKNTEVISTIQDNVDITKTVGEVKSQPDNDSEKVRVYSYSDRYLQYEAIADSILRFTKFNLPDTIYTIRYKDGKYQKYSITHTNKYIHTSDASDIEFKTPSVKHWSIGPTIGYGIGKSGLQPFAGISISYNLIRF